MEDYKGEFMSAQKYIRKLKKEIQILRIGLYVVISISLIAILTSCGTSKHTERVPDVKETIDTLRGTPKELNKSLDHHFAEVDKTIEPTRKELRHERKETRESNKHIRKSKKQSNKHSEKLAVIKFKSDRDYNATTVLIEKQETKQDRIEKNKTRIVGNDQNVIARQDRKIANSDNNKSMVIWIVVGVIFLFAIIIILILLRNFNKFVKG